MPAKSGGFGGVGVALRTFGAGLIGGVVLLLALLAEGRPATPDPGADPSTHQEPR